MEKKRSKKTTIIISVICLILAAAAFGALFAASSIKAKSRIASISFTQEITVKDRTAEPQSVERELPIAEAGRYYFYVDWKAPQTDFLTGCVIKDEEGQVRFVVTGDSVEVTSVDLDLKAQTYRVEMHYLTNEADYFRFVKDYIGKTAEPEPFAFSGPGTDSVQNIEYTVEARGVSDLHAAGTAAVLINSLIIVVLFLTLIKKGNAGKLQYDERQTLVRGNGAKYGFFTLLLCNGLVYAAEMANLPQFADTSAVMIFNCLTGLCVYIVYCIWNDGYFALNADKGRLMAGLAVLGIFNLLLSAFGFTSGKLIQNGRLTFRSANLFCGISFLVIFSAMLLKKYRQDKEDEQP